jgi:predicted Zn-dependent protease
MRRFATHLIAAGILLAFPGSTNADSLKPSKKDQLSLGKRVATDIRKKERIVSDSDPKVVKLREIAKKLIEATPLTKDEPWEFSFDIVTDKSLNAFALPGGPIFFHSALYDKFLTEDQIAGVLAHEMIHIRKEHWASSYADQVKRSLGITIVLVLLRANRTATDIASISNDLLLTLPFSRRHESESDMIGLEAMIKAGYNPQGMADAFKILAEGRKGSKPPEFLSTHPDIDKRIKRIEENIAKQTISFRPQVPLAWAQSS